MLKYIIPVVVVMFIAVGLIFALQAKTADPATAASSAEKLKAIKLPSNLPKLIDASGTDATASYIEAIELASSKADYLKAGRRDQAVVDELVALMQTAGAGATATPGWADRYVELRPGAQTSWNGAPGAIAKAVLEDQVDSKIAGGQFNGSKEAAEKIIDAVFTFGWNLYSQNTRVLVRRSGLGVMEEALRLRELVLEDRGAAEWRTAVGRLGIRWEEKLKAMYKTDGSVADLVRFAELDEDTGFRVEAIMQLGVAQWTKRTTGNKWSAEAALDKLSTSKTPIVAEAAKASRKLTRQDVHRAN